MNSVDRTEPRRSARRRVRRAAIVALGLVAIAIAADAIWPTVSAQTFCGLRYVAAGDDIPAGHDVSETQRYPYKLWEDHLKKWGQWCVFNVAQNKTTSTTEISGGQLAQTWNYRPDLITLTVGEQNTKMVNLI